jgi:ribonuclease HIII
MKKKKNTEEEGPKKTSLYTIKLTSEQMEKLGELLDQRGWFFYDVAYSQFAFKSDQVNVVGYKSGKLVVQGKKTEEFVRDIVEAEITLDAQLGYDEVHHPEWFEAHAGLDESGKGDVLGPLVVCTVIADGNMVREWMDQGIKDSKRISSDASIKKLAKIIASTKGVVYKTGYANMRKYNELYDRFKNLNRLLGWFHYKALEDALARKSVKWGMLDQFSKQPIVQKYIKQPQFELRMQTKAEADPLVAAASILARAVYVDQMEKLSEKCGEDLLKGASSAVKDQLGRIISKHGPDALGDYAKLHFKTCKEVLAG